MRRSLAGIGVAVALFAGVANAAPSAAVSDPRAERIIASISARAGPDYLKTARALAQAAMKLRGRARLRRLMLAETEITDYERDAEAGQLAAQVLALARTDPDARYAAMAGIELARIEASSSQAAMDRMKALAAPVPDPIVQAFLAGELSGYETMLGHPDKAFAIIDRAESRVPRSDPDSTFVLNELAQARAYSLSQMGDINGVLTALSDAEFRYRLPEGPVGALSELTLLGLEAIDLEDEATARKAYAAFRRIRPVGQELQPMLHDLYECQRIEQTFGTPKQVLACGEGLDWRRFRNAKENSGTIYGYRGLAYAQLGRTREAERDAATLEAMNRQKLKDSKFTSAVQLDAWLDVRHGRAVDGAAKLESLRKHELSEMKQQFRDIVPQLTAALQRDLDLARRNEQQQSTIILFQWAMGGVAAVICAAAIAILMWQRRLNRKLLAANARAEAAQHRAEEANALKSQFLANVSHEVRTPLNGVLGMIQAMAADELNPVQRERLEVLRGSSRGMLTILNDLLDLAKIEAGKLTLESVEFDLASVAEGSRHAFWAAAQAKGLALELTVEDDARGLYRGDPTRLRQVVDNLVSNAIKFTTEGGVHVTFAPMGEGAGLRLTVRDTGIGLTAEQAAKIFAKFEQADASTTRKYGGTGLGLSICRELVLAFGGEISVASTPGQGTVFTAELPLPRIGDSPAGGGEAAATEACGLEDAGEGLRILAAEDHPVNQLVLRTLLSQLGCEVTLVGDGAQALEAFRAGRWDVVLMDIQMPVMDGLEATRAIRGLERREGAARTPLVALTANAMPDQVAEYRAAGFDDHLSKPIDAGELLAVLNRALAGSAAAPEMAVA